MDISLRNKKLVIVSNLLSLRFYLSFKKKFTFKFIYYYLIGEREKYVLLNLSLLASTLVKLSFFFKYSLIANNNFCFVSFNPTFANLTKQLALLTNQTYITGVWLNGFFSKFIDAKFFTAGDYKKLDLNLFWTKMPIFIFITSANSKYFFSELLHLHVPTIAIIDGQTDPTKYAYPIICETYSLESVFFYSRLLVYFINFFIKKKL
jgi:ribosomal protein S2